MAARQRLTFAGLTEAQILDCVRDGRSLTEIAAALGEARSTLQRWLDADPDRSARAREARFASAQAWDEKAEEAILSAADTLALARAREIAHHYRWRASKIAPIQYGTQVQLDLGAKPSLADLLVQMHKEDPTVKHTGPDGVTRFVRASSLGPSDRTDAA